MERLKPHKIHFGRRGQTPGGCRTAALDGIAALVVLGGVYLGITQWQRITSEAAVSAWAAEIRAKLQDPSRNLTSGFYPKVKVVAAGETLPELWEMQKDGTPVNVRDRPYGQIIGQIALGSEIHNVVLIADSSLPKPWGAFSCSDSPVKLTNRGKPALDATCFVDADYLAAVK